MEIVLAFLFLLAFSSAIIKACEEDGGFDFLIVRKFRKKRRFKQKVLQNGYTSIWSFLDTLLDTTVNDWQFRGAIKNNVLDYRGNQMMCYHPFPATTISFNNYSSVYWGLEIYEGSSEKLVFFINYDPELKKILNGYDYLTKQTVSFKNEMKLETVFLYLEHILEKILQDKEHEEQQTKHRKEETFLRKKQQRINELRCFLEECSTVQPFITRGLFTIQHTEDNYGSNLFILMENVIYFQAMHLKKTNEFRCKFYHEDKPFALIFKELEGMLHTFATQQLIGQNTVFSFTAQQQETIGQIQTLLTQLAQEKSWLSDVTYHQVTETLPKDLHALSDVYKLLNDKEDVQADVSHALEVIKQKLHAFATEAERNKQFQLKKRICVIEKR